MSELTKESEEFQMLLEVAKQTTEEIIRAMKSGEKTKIRKTSGQATKNVIREHLQSHSLNVSQNLVYINPSIKKIHLLVLEKGINPNKKFYSLNEVSTVLEIRNNAVGSADRNPNSIIRNRFDELERDTKINRFAVIVLSERLLSRKPYKWRITEEEIGKENCRVFTLVARKKYPKGGLYRMDAIMEMREKKEMKRTGEWDELVSYLSSTC